MTMVRLDPFAMLREFDRLFEGEGQLERTWVPRIDAFTVDGKLVVRAEVPGVAPEDIDVTVEDGKLVISGKRHFEDEVTEAGWHRKEIFEGEFKRTLFLPESADLEKIEAKTRNGILEVTIPMMAEALPKKVTVKVED
ncbi:MAG TPA: Hsp20/alpha crystallin family protein [Actinobacteria bacterium]|nr:Hsp20/alpha crystallin family protein [Actinomycetota bacterium]